jgi:DNA-binding PadR family transcriptional regulator
MSRHFGPGFEFGKFGPGVFGMRFGPRGFGFGGPHGGGFGGDWAEEFGFGGGGRRGRRGRMFESGELRLVLLKLIADQPRHGYDLIRAIEELTHGSYAPSPGIVYPTLTLLQDMGLIEEAAGEGARKPFAITAEGRAHLAERADEVDGLLERLTGAGEGKRRAGGRPIQRAVGNLLSALWHRVTAEDMGEERLHEIAAILDDAAQQIERLKGSAA